MGASLEASLPAPCTWAGLGLRVSGRRSARMEAGSAWRMVSMKGWKGPRTGAGGDWERV